MSIMAEVTQFKCLAVWKAVSALCKSEHLAPVPNRHSSRAPVTPHRAREVAMAGLNARIMREFGPRYECGEFEIPF